MMKRLVLIGIAIAIVLSSVISCAPNDEKEQAAVTAADKWLTLVDTGKYLESWQEADDYFKSSIQQGQWGQVLQSARTPMGKVISRKLRTKTYKTSPPDMPRGQYFELQFETFFQNTNVMETVVLMFDKDGSWRVSGYHYKSPRYSRYSQMKMVIDDIGDGLLGD